LQNGFWNFLGVLPVAEVFQKCLRTANVAEGFKTFLRISRIASVGATQVAEGLGSAAIACRMRKSLGISERTAGYQKHWRMECVLQKL
jgi:hypothetical protein